MRKPNRNQKINYNMNQYSENSDLTSEAEEPLDDLRLDHEIEESMIQQMWADGIPDERIEEIFHNLFWYGSVRSPDDVRSKARMTERQSSHAGTGSENIG